MPSFFSFLLALTVATNSLTPVVVVDAAGEDLIQPASVSSSGGLLETMLSMEVATISTPDYEIVTRALNGTVPGPTIRLRAGDTFKLRLVNNLNQGQGNDFVNNAISAPDETNIHYHGLHVDGDLPSDYSKFVLKPGQEYTYTSLLPPLYVTPTPNVSNTHLGGTHWLHPHRHGSTTVQVVGGAASAIIVDDPDGFLPAQVASSQEVIMVVQQLFLGDAASLESQAGGNTFKVIRGGGGLTVNGQIQPVVRTDANQWMRLRIIFAAWKKGRLQVSVSGCEMQLLAKDGVYIRNFPRSISTATIFLGGRADIMVRCPNPSSTYTIKDGGNTLATISTSANTVTSTSFQPWTFTYPDYLQDLTNTPASPGCSCVTSFGGREVNGKSFSPNNSTPLHEGYLGAVMERRIEAGDHPYHQHVYPFQLVSGGTSGETQKGDWFDTYDGTATIRYHPREFVSKIMVHCHRLEHEDEGMMAHEFIHEASFGQCTCTPNPGLAVWIIILIVLGSVVVLLGVYAFVARRYAWWPFRNRSRGVVEKEDEEYGDEEGDDDKFVG